TQQQVVQPLLRVAILGEHDDSLGAPLSVPVEADLSEPRDQRLRASIGFVASLLGPAPQLFEDLSLFWCERWLPARRGRHRFSGEFIRVVIARLVVSSI